MAEPWHCVLVCPFRISSLCNFTQQASTVLVASSLRAPEERAAFFATPRASVSWRGRGVGPEKDHIYLHLNHL